MRAPMMSLPPTGERSRILTALLLIGLLLAGAGCSGATTADASEPGLLPSGADAEINWISVETGHQCAVGRVACGVGNCAANISNECRQTLTCELTVQSVCRAYTGESGEALAHAKETVGPGERGGVLARVVCGDGEVLATLAKRLKCN